MLVLSLYFFYFINCVFGCFFFRRMFLHLFVWIMLNIFSLILSSFHFTMLFLFSRLLLLINCFSLVILFLKWIWVIKINILLSWIFVYHRGLSFFYFLFFIFCHYLLSFRCHNIFSSSLCSTSKLIIWIFFWLGFIFILFCLWISFFT